jgi:hypothetical protein
MGVASQKQRAISALLLSIKANGLSDGENMVSIERAIKATRCAGTAGSGTSV